jgi:MFS superfamily sulfate permease-like transporter/mannitol/fructose-specific phosphotransferase system IIA component (Ntr-type)
MASQPTPSGSKPQSTPKPWLADSLASLVVFLVALPLCIGIAVACGVPPERGLLTGIVGGIAVGFITGAPLLVSGPAASLIVPVFELVESHGLAALAPVVMLAGLCQAVAGVLRLGQWFRAVAPAVIHGMLIGIGVLILGSQMHVSIDEDPKSSFMQNVVTLPGAVFGRLTEGVEAATPIAILVATLVLLVAWNRFRPKKLELVPGHLVALFGVTAAATFLKLPLRFLDISENFFAGLDPVSVADFSVLLDPAMIGRALTFAFVASAATLLTATAIDKRQSHTKTDYDKEMIAQGVGNALAGGLGGLPMTGVIVRSSVNVDAGARTRRSTILHGIWLLIFVAVAPQVLELIPRASLGAILVFTGYKLIDVRVFRELYERGRSELVICLITLFGVVFVDLFAGILAGFAAALLKVVYTFTHLEVRSEPNDNGRTHDLHLAGSATFVRLPQLAQVLDRVSDDRELHVHIDRLDHIDHACLELLSAWSQRRENAGAPGMVVEWEELTNRYQKAVTGSRDAGPSKSLLRIVWEEWKSVYRTERRPSARKVVTERWLEPSRAHARLDASDVAGVIAHASTLLAPHAGATEEQLRRALSARREAHIAIGDGVSLPHAALPGLKTPVVGLVTTDQPIPVDEEQADVFFVLLAPDDDPQTHLRTLAHVGRLCHDPDLLARLREAEDPETIVRAVDEAEAHITEQHVPRSGSQTRNLIVIEVDTKEAAEHLRPVIAEGFGDPDVWRVAQAASLRSLLSINPSHHIVALELDLRDLRMLQSLLEEQARLLPGEVARVHQLQPIQTDLRQVEGVQAS